MGNGGHQNQSFCFTAMTTTDANPVARTPAAISSGEQFGLDMRLRPRVSVSLQVFGVKSASNHLGRLGATAADPVFDGAV